MLCVFTAKLRITSYITYFIHIFLLPLQKIVKPTLKPKNYINETYHTAYCYADNVASWLYPKP